VYSSFERVDPHGYVRDFLEFPREGAIKEWLEVRSIYVYIYI